MKTTIVRSVLWVLPLLAFQISLNAQTTTPAPATTTPTTSAPTTSTPAKPAAKKNKFAFKRDMFAIDAEAGASRPMNTNLSQVFTAGADASLGLKLGLLKKRLWLRPEGGIKFFTHKATLNTQSVREMFRDWHAGVEVQYRIYDFRKLSFYPLVRVDQNWSSNYFSNVTNDKTASSTAIQTSETFLKGTGNSYGGGVMVTYKGSLYVKAYYTYFQPVLNVHPDLIRDELTQGVIMPSTQKFDCSTVNLCIGFNLNFKK